MCCPSGDQLGQVAPAVSLVSRVSAEPSAFITYIWEWPSRVLVKAIFEDEAEVAATCPERSGCGAVASSRHACGASARRTNTAGTTRLMGGSRAQGPTVAALQFECPATHVI